MYYLRTRPAVDAVQFTVDKTALFKSQQAGLLLLNGVPKEDVTEAKNGFDSGAIVEEEEGCVMCSG